MKEIDEFPEFIKGLPEIELPVPGSRGYLMQGASQQIVFMEFNQDIEMPEHTHAEQWEFPLAGKAVLHIDGDSREYRAGDNFYIPANVPHGATVPAGYKAMAIFNTPDRYSPKD